VKIESPKDLQKLIQLCRKTGVKSISIDGITLELGQEPTKYPARRTKRANGKTLTTDGTQDVPDLVDSPDELTEEQLMFYSAVGQGNEQ
jgi:hypothetical protein